MTVDATDEAPEIVVVSGPDAASKGDAGKEDASSGDASREDASREDASNADGSNDDASLRDAGPEASDSSAADAAGDAAQPEAGPPECVEGASTCQHDAVVTCTAAGVWSSPVPCGTATPYCLGAGLCAACVPGAAQCSSGTSVQTCSATGQWGSSTTCAPGACQGGQCVGDCTPGAVQCSGNGPQVCGANGQWGTATACSNQTCLAGQCQGVCAPGQTQCNGAVPQTCDASNGHWVSGTVTPGQCGAVCTPGAMQCSGNGVEACGVSGQWSGPTSCTHQTCVAGACTGVCAPSDKECSGNGVASCGATGQWSSAVACTNQTCLGGACSGVCAPGQTQCDGPVPQTCNASDGQWTSGAVTAGQCGAVCTPGAVVCSGTAGDYGVETCSAAGQWGSALACAAPTPLCLNGACAPCTGATTACGRECVDEQTDATNCGACGHNCLGGSCSAGVCQPVTLVSSSDVYGGYVATDGSNVYWTTPSQLLSCSVGGGCGTGTVVYTAPSGWRVYGVALPSSSSPDSASAYVGANDEADEVSYLVQVTKATLATKAMPLPSSITEPSNLVFDSVDSRVYLANPGNLARVAPDGTQASVVLESVAFQLGVQTLAVDSMHVYAAAAGTDDVYACPLIGTCGPANLAMTGLGAGLMGAYSDGNYLWAAGSSAIYRCATDMTCATPTPFASGQSGPQSIVADASHVYWADGTDIKRCSVGGCVGSPTVYVSGINPGETWDLAQDTVAIYWLDQTGVHKIAK